MKYLASTEPLRRAGLSVAAEILVKGHGTGLAA